MANIDDYNAKIGEILAIPDKDVFEPTIPVDVFLQESENLGKWAMMDLAPLAAVGITDVKIADMAVRTGALREAQSVWFKDRNAQLDAQREWGIQSPLAFGLRDELVHGILDDMAQIAAGAPLPALGEGQACTWCEARGLCRRDFWSP